MFCFNLSWHVGSWSHQHTDWGVGTDGRWWESRAWRFVDVNDLVSCAVYAQPLSLWLSWRLINQWPFPTGHGQTWQGHASCSGLTQLVKSWESLACLQLCSGSPVGRWWKLCSCGLAVQWQRSCFQSDPRCSAGVCWVVGLRQHLWPSPCRTHPARVAVVALVVTGLVDISSECRTGGPREGTCHPPWGACTP